MGIFYDTVLKIRKNGRNFVENKPKEEKAPKKAEKPTVKAKKPAEMAVKKDDKPTGGKS